MIGLNLGALNRDKTVSRRRTINVTSTIKNMRVTISVGALTLVLVSAGWAAAGAV